MKKILLSLIAVSSSMFAFAQTETKIIYDAVCGLSPNGQYAASSNNGSVVIYDLDTDEHYIYAESTTSAYNTGNGNFWANGAMVGCVNNSGNSGVWYNGRWTKLPLSSVNPAGIGQANAITPDRKRICGTGSTGTGIVLDDERLMAYPCYWDANENGTYGSQTALPYPEKDFLGWIPQYVTAVSISEDGRTIAGQVVSGNGFFIELIIYHQAEDGTWSYELPLRSLCNPDNLEIPAYPGDGPAVPSQENFMTAEEIEQFDAALQAYYKDMDNTPMPTYEQFMTEEEIAQYQESLIPYNEWAVKYTAYENVIIQLLRTSTSFSFNIVPMSSNGRYVALAAQHSTYSASGITSYYTPFIYDTVTKEGKEIGMDDYSMLVTAVSNDGDVLGYIDAGDAELAYVRKASDEKWVKYSDYLIERDPSLEKWIEDNWIHEVEVVVDENTNATDFETMEITGVPYVSADWNSFVSTAYNFWGGDGANSYMGYVIRFSGSNGIDSVTEGQGSDSVTYYDLQGRSVKNPSNGIFIRKAGNTTSKVRL